MRTFKSLYEAWTNDISKSSREKSVTDDVKYNSPTEFKKNATKVGKVGPLEIHASQTPSGGITHFTWSPKDNKIHHVVHAVSHKETDGKHELGFLSAHARESSPVRMHHVYSTLAKDHGREFVGTGHSEGARKMWSKFHDDPDLEVVGQHPDGRIQKLNKDDKMYASKKTKDPEEQKIGRMKLIMRKRQSEKKV